MTNAYIVDAVRTPFGKREVVSETYPSDLAAELLHALEKRNGFVGQDDIEDVIYGCVTPVHGQGLSIGRVAPIVAGWGETCQGSSSTACVARAKRSPTSPPDRFVETCTTYWLAVASNT
jgi:acetyl-CoA acetyltransferase